MEFIKYLYIYMYKERERKIEISKVQSLFFSDSSYFYFIKREIKFLRIKKSERKEGEERRQFYWNLSNICTYICIKRERERERRKN